MHALLPSAPAPAPAPASPGPSSPPPRVVLPSSFDIATVTAVARELGDALTLGDVSVDIAAVTRVDAAGLQLLAAAVSAARIGGIRITWSGSSRALGDGARTLALAAALELPDSHTAELR